MLIKYFTFFICEYYIRLIIFDCKFVGCALFVLTMCSCIPIEFLFFVFYDIYIYILFYKKMLYKYVKLYKNI